MIDFEELSPLKEKKEEYLKHVRPEFIELSQRKRKLSLSDINTIVCNSYEWSLLAKNYDADVLIGKLVYFYKNSSYDERYKYDLPPVTYDESLLSEYIPLIINAIQQNEIGKTSKFQKVMFKLKNKWGKNGKTKSNK